ncbi:MAG: peptide deformylase [Nitrospirae bacterium]|nr:peptide deformylase [Nitrospirota bacterium]
MSIRLIVFDPSVRNEEGKLTVLLNPEIIEKDGEAIMKEGCLSVPGLEAEIKRAENIKVTGLDKNGNAVNIDATGFLATVIQHEIDHLDGILLLDRIGFIKRDIFKRRLMKQLKEAAREQAVK